MTADQIKIKFIKKVSKGTKKGKPYLFPKPYVFKLTPKDKAEFKEKLQPNQKGLIEVAKLKGEGTVHCPFMIVDVGHFDDQMHKPLKIIKMFDK